MKVYIVKAFTKNKEEGNPAGVVLDADEMHEETMLRISKKLGFSESAFVQHADTADVKVRFFSPTQEVNICAHATIAAFYAMLINKKLPLDSNVATTFTQETVSGNIAITCFPDGRIVMRQKEPEFLAIEPDKKSIALLLGITKDDIVDNPIQIVSTGTPKLLIPLQSLDILLRIKPDLDGIKEYCIKSGAKGFYPFTHETLDTNADFHARQFNPLAGINEDPITGIAAGALACYTNRYKLVYKKNLVIEQGFSMGKPGEVFVDITNGVEVGGYAVLSAIEDILL